MRHVDVHPRVHERHPEITEADVLHAWSDCVRAMPRSTEDFSEYIAVGFDGSGRVLELIAKRGKDGTLLIYHAMTPPTKKMLWELGLIRRQA